MKRYELEAMNKEALREHADVQGIKLGAEDTKGQMIDRILGDAAPAIEEEAPAKRMQKDAPMPPLRGLHSLSGEPSSGKRYKLKINASVEGDNSPVPIIVNGHNIIVQRGKEVEVDEAYIRVLENAVIQTVRQDPDTGERIPMEMQAYPFSAIPV